MATITTHDGTTIYYQDMGSGQPILFSHGWPLSSAAWDRQLVDFAHLGFRTIAHDRRSHGHSSQTWDGNNMDQYADDLAELIEQLDLKDIVLVGHSTGGGEVTHYCGRHGTSRVARIVLVGAVPPIMLKSDSNPEGTPIETFDGIRAGTLNRAQFYKDLSMPFYGFNRDGAQVQEGLRENFWLQGMLGGLKGHYDCVHEFSEVDYTEDLRKIEVPALVIHGEDDQIVPIAAAGLKSSRILPNATLKVYQGAPHGLAETMPEKFNADLLAFVKGEASVDPEAMLIAQPISR